MRDLRKTLVVDISRLVQEMAADAARQSDIHVQKPQGFNANLASPATMPQSVPEPDCENIRSLNVLAVPSEGQSQRLGTSLAHRGASEPRNLTMGFDDLALPSTPATPPAFRLPFGIEARPALFAGGSAEDHRGAVA